MTEKWIECRNHTFACVFIHMMKDLHFNELIWIFNTRFFGMYVAILVFSFLMEDMEKIYSEAVFFVLFWQQFSVGYNKNIRHYDLVLKEDFLTQ